MPPHRHRHKKDLNYWLRKLIPSFRSSNRKRIHNSWQPDSGTRFLTLEEVKAAQAESKEREFHLGTSEARSIFDDAKELQRPKIPVQRRKKKKTATYRLRKLFSGIRFRLWNKKRRSSAPSEYKYLTFEDVKGSKSVEDELGSLLPDQDGFKMKHTELLQRSQPSGKHRHKKRRKGFWRRFGFGKKKENSGLINPLGDFGEPDKGRIQVKNYVRTVVNSTAVFMIAYQVSWLFYQMAVMLAASFNKIDSVLYYYEVMFPIGNNSPKWNQSNIIFITLSGPLISLILWIVYRYVLLKRLHPGSQFRLFLVWLNLNSMMLFFGAFVGGAITRQGFGYVVEWLYMNIAFRILFSMVFLTMIMWLNWNIVKLLPETSGPDSWKQNRFAYIMSRLVVPWFIGSGIMIMLKITNVLPQHENIFNYDSINLATLLFAIVPPLFNSKAHPHRIQGRKTYPKVHRSTVFIWVIVALVFIFMIRFGLSRGLYFQMKISMDIGIYH
ncbi:MAG: hypothetical protein HXX13_02195 [Bacteroidetes bacterium]|nr:hypothetical protein [Bacteroidota bacterium]